MGLFRNQSITRRLTTMNVLVSLTALVLACAGFFTYDIISIRESLVRTVSSQAQIIAINSSAAIIFNDPDATRRMLQGLSGSRNIVAAVIVTPDNRVFARYGNPILVPSDLAPSVADEERYAFSRAELTLSRAIVADGKLIGTLYIVSDLRDVKDRLLRYAAIALAVLLIAMLAALLISNVIKRSIASPIIDLANIAQNVSLDRNYSVRAPAPNDRSEVAVLFESFNRMLHQIEASEHALRSLVHESTATLQSIPQLVFTADVHGHIEFYNQRWFDFTGMNPHGSFDNWEPYIHPDDLAVVEHAWKESLEKGKPYRMSYRLRRHDGVYRWFLAQAVPIRKEEGSIQKWFGTSTDIHEQKLAEEALIRAEKLAATGRMAATVAHEINNPLAAITNVVHLLSNNPDLTKEAELLKVLSEEVNRVSHIVKSTLGLARQNAVVEKVSASELVEQVLILYEKRFASRNIRLERAYGKNLHPVHVGPTEIRQVISNLLSNALDVVGNDGRVKLAVHNALSNHSGTKGVRITIADAGPGIPSQVRPRLFEPFFSTKADMGTGLGLWVSKGIIEKYGGTLRYRTSTAPERHGTAFSIFLPTTKDHPYDQAAATSHTL